MILLEIEKNNVYTYSFSKATIIPSSKRSVTIAYGLERGQKLIPLSNVGWIFLCFGVFWLFLSGFFLSLLSLFHSISIGLKSSPSQNRTAHSTAQHSIKVKLCKQIKPIFLFSFHYELKRKLNENFTSQLKISDIPYVGYIFFLNVALHATVLFFR